MEEIINNFKLHNMLNYFLCSKSVIDIFPTLNKSKFFKSGYEYDKSSYCVACVDFNAVVDYYNRSVINGDTDFICREVVSGTMDVSKISIAGIKINGLFLEIEKVIGLTSEGNIAMTINELSRKYNCNPIEFTNKFAKYQ